MQTLLVYHRGRLEAHADPSTISELRQQPETLIWLDLEAPDQRELALLADEFGFHPLALEDAQKKGQRPKLDRYEGYQYLVLYDASPAPTLDGGPEFREVDIFLGRNSVVTLHDTAVAAIAELRARWVQAPTIVEPHPLSFLLYHLADGLVDDYFPVLDQLGERIELIEERLFAQADQTILREIFRTRHDLLTVRRILAPTRDVFNLLSRRDQPVFDPRTVVYFTDVYDHLLRMTDTLDTYRDLLSAALDAYLSVRSNDLNQVMRTLTAVTVSLMVPTLIAGVYGMNYRLIPDNDAALGFPFAVALMALAAGALLAYFRRRSWL